MPATRRVVLDLPVEQADRIDAEVAAGRYPSPGAFVAARLASEDNLFSELAGLDWDTLAAEVADEARRIDAGEAASYPADEVFDDLETRISARAAELRSRA